MADPYHKPVLLDEVIAGLALKQGGIYVDATVGGGGHSRAIAEKIGADGTVIGIDRDAEALDEAERTLAGTPAKFLTYQAPFDRIVAILSELKHSSVEGVLYDLGVSSHQLDDATRGFTFRDSSAPLDMRMSQSEDIPTAADLLNELSVAELTVMLRENSDERWAARIAEFIVERRSDAPFKSAAQLIDVIKAAIPAAARPKEIHPATKAFQALRIAVNDEFGRLRRSLMGAVASLKPGGHIAVISYHSGEDRIVKQTFSEMSGKCICPPELPKCVCQASEPLIELITKKPVVPTQIEIAENPRARSAKLRIVRKRSIR